LKPALTIKSKIVSMHDIAASEWISYNRTWTAENESKVASIPFGYFEWLPRSASNKIVFKHKKDFVKQIGSICMNLCCIQTDNWEIWDDIEIIWLEWENTLNNLATQANRLIYEILVNLDRNIRRETL
jgi:alanine racemase